MSEIDYLNHEQLLEFIKKMSKKDLIEFMITENFDFIQNIDLWLGNNSKANPFLYHKFHKNFIKVIYLKIKYINSGIIDINYFTNQELLLYCEKIIEDPIFKEDDYFKKAYDTLSERIKIIKQNSVINGIDIMLKRAKINDDLLKKVIKFNNYNLYDILIHFVSITEAPEDKKQIVINELLRGNFDLTPLEYDEEIIDNDYFTVGLLRNKIMRITNGQPVLIENFFDRLYEIGAGINPLLLDLETDYKEGRYYKMRKKNIN